jgi:ribosomal protein S12 methylthiotransferase accessory factor YcaO
VLVRRAAAELIRNLVGGSDDLFEKYSTSESKLQVMLALSDVDDLHTRLAASGSLATLTMEPAASRALLELQMKRGRVVAVFTQLIDPSSSEESESISGDSNPGLVHRGVICARNFLLNMQNLDEKQQISSDAEKAGLTKALARVVQDGSVTDAVKKPAADALKFLLELRSSR